MFFGKQALAQLSLIKQDSSLANAWRAKPKLYFGFDNASSIAYDYELLNRIGIKAGLIWGGRYRIGFGTYSIFTPPPNLFKYGDSLFRGKRSLRYNTIFFEPLWVKNDKWLISTPLSYGVGRVGIKEKTGSYAFKPMTMFEVDLIGYYKIYDWLGIGISGGYRFAFNNQTQLVYNDASGLLIGVKPKLFLAEFVNFLAYRHRKQVDRHFNNFEYNSPNDTTIWNPGIWKN
ncbi:MAG: hypothetical protein SGJ04_02355 [Bacteroidota bacterium]|nr:hypothetical protein [Bacteroidota bacterium]